MEKIPINIFSHINRRKCSSGAIISRASFNSHIIRLQNDRHDTYAIKVCINAGIIINSYYTKVQYQEMVDSHTTSPWSFRDPSCRHDLWSWKLLRHGFGCGGGKVVSAIKAERMSQSGGVGAAAYLFWTAVSSVVEQRVMSRLTAAAAALSVQQRGHEGTFVPSQDSLWCLSVCGLRLHGNNCRTNT